MSRYIDADGIEYSDFDLTFIPVVLKNIAYKEDIDNIPTADVEPVRHGHWIPHKTIARSPFVKNYSCSECGRESFVYPNCPYCRAKMDEKEEE